MKIQTLKYYLPAIIWAIVILGLSVSSDIRIPSPEIIQMDKLGHLLAYGLLTGLILFGLRWKEDYNMRRAIWAVFIVSLYGILLECVQWAFFPYRFFEVWDMIANITGALLSILLFRFLILKT